MLNIYLTFDGNCREAFNFYKSVFGGDFQAFQTFADGPPEMQGEHNDLVMHVSLPIGSTVLMGSDTAAGHGPPFQAGNNFSISIVGESKQHGDDVFAILGEGGTITMPLADTFWGSYFGMLTDKFGINWMFNYAMTDTQA